VPSSCLAWVGSDVGQNGTADRPPLSSRSESAGADGYDLISGDPVLQPRAPA